jgi:anti-sigma-K factor RskA
VTDPTSTPDASELDALLGAYALDALDPADRARVETYLERNADARAEVDEMRETAASLALLPDTPMDAPPELWQRITHVIATDDDTTATATATGPTTATGPVDAPVDELAARRDRSRLRWLAPLSIAAAIAIVLLIAQVSSLRNQLDTAHQVGPDAMAAAFNRAADAPGAKEVGLKSDSGATLARVVLLPDGSGYLRGDHLDALPADKTYQLWAVTGSPKDPTIVSAGVLGPTPSALGFRASGPVHAFAVTVENAGGVVASKQKPIAQGAVA